MQLVQYSPSTPVVCTYFSGRVVKVADDDVAKAVESAGDVEPGTRLLAIVSRVIPSVVVLENCRNLRRGSDLIGSLFFFMLSQRQNKTL